MVTIGFIGAAVAGRGEISSDAKLHRCRIRRVKAALKIDIILILPEAMLTLVYVQPERQLPKAKSPGPMSGAPEALHL
ncbi:MAG TPA: hypothetical protein VMR17_17050, partial [Xanthobacteraceae bacterium]|nr:hypothetical protein [Xanthobacteraceae bacterium]